MVKCLYIHNANYHKVIDIDKNILPDKQLIKDALFPLPFHMNIFNCKDKLSGLFETNQLQISFVWHGSMRKKYQKQLVFIFPRPINWTQKDFLVLFKQYGGNSVKNGSFNKMGTFINKAHKILGPMLIFLTTRDIVKSDYNMLVNDANDKRKFNERINANNSSIDRNKFKNDREARKKMAHGAFKALKKFKYMPLETLYLIFLPQLLEFYVHEGKEYFNSFPCYSFSYEPGYILQFILTLYSNNNQSSDCLWKSNENKITNDYKPGEWNVINKHMLCQAEKYKFKYRPYFS